MSRPRGRALVGVLAVALVLLTACVGSPPPTGAPAQVLRIGVVPNLALTAPLVGAAEGLARSGVAQAVEFVPTPSPDVIRSSLTAQRVDVAGMPLTTAAQLANGGVDLTLVGVVDSRLLKVVGPVGARGWEGLRGQTVHVAFRGDFTDLVFGILAAARGLVPGRDFTIAYDAALPETVSALATGRAAYAVLPEQWASQGANQATAARRPTTAMLDLTEAWRETTGAATLPASAIVVPTRLAEERPGLVARLREQFAAGTAAVTADPAAGAPELARLARVDPALAATLLPTLQPRFVVAAEARRDVDDLLARVTAREARSTGGGPPGDAFYAG